MAIYIGIMNEIAEKIRNGRFQHGRSPTSEKRLRKHFNVSRTSVRNALNVLQKEGFIEKRRGSGNVVMNQTMARNKESVIATILVDILDDQAEPTFFSNKSNIFKLKGINTVEQRKEAEDVNVPALQGRT